MDIKEYVRSLLMDPTIISITGDGTVHYIHAVSPKPPHIEYEFYDENGALWEEGIEVAADYYLQVDIFSKAEDGAYTSLENAIKNKLISAGFVRDTAADMYESDTKLYHKAMRFIYSE